jgi:hypothetical protein
MPNSARTSNAIAVAPPISKTALTIWTQVVAIMPPRSRSVSITAPTITTESAFR